MENKDLSRQELVSDLRNLGVQKGDMLNVKVSYKSIGKIDGGINTLIEALLKAVGEEGTIVSDSFIYGKFMYPLQKRAGVIVDNTTTSYAGAVANAMIAYPGSMRSPHPIHKFVAIGKNADIVNNYDANSIPYSLLPQMIERGAKNLRIGDKSKVVGIGTTHVAVEMLGHMQNIFKTGVDYYEDGKLKTFIVNWPTSCPTGYKALLPLYEQGGCNVKNGYIGKAEAMLTLMRETLDYELSLGKENPYFAMCEDPTCYKCRLMWSHSTGNIFRVIWENLKVHKKKNFKNIISALYLSLFKRVCPK